MEVDKVELEDTEEQVARAYLRERFLKAITHLAGKECTVNMYENTKVTCKLRTFDPDISNVIVEDLDTPINKRIPKAILRTSDIISMHVTLNE